MKFSSLILLAVPVAASTESFERMLRGQRQLNQGQGQGGASNSQSDCEDHPNFHFGFKLSYNNQEGCVEGTFNLGDSTYFEVRDQDPDATSCDPIKAAAGNIQVTVTCYNDDGTTGCTDDCSYATVTSTGTLDEIKVKGGQEETLFWDYDSPDYNTYVGVCPAADASCQGISNIEFCFPCDGPPPPPPGPQVEGDPHFKSWSGKWFDYMGQCDLKFMEAPKFDGKQDMNIHIRTSLIHQYSLVEAAAIKIGDDVLEVAGYGDYALNGVDFAKGRNKVGTIGGYDVFHNELNKKKNTYDIVLGPNENITLASYKNLVSVQVNVQDPKKYFSDVTGIIGSIDGDLLSRSGELMDPETNEVAYGQEWQITDQEPMIFRSARAPQYPAQCQMATKTAEAARRLGETISEEAAQLACAHKTGVQFTNCVYDVMAIGDLELATSGVY